MKKRDNNKKEVTRIKLKKTKGLVVNKRTSQREPNPWKEMRLQLKPLSKAYNKFRRKRKIAKEKEERRRLKEDEEQKLREETALRLQEQEERRLKKQKEIKEEEERILKFQEKQKLEKKRIKEEKEERIKKERIYKERLIKGEQERLGRLMGVKEKALNPNRPSGSNISKDEKNKIYKTLKEVEEKIASLKKAIE